MDVSLATYNQVYNYSYHRSHDATVVKAKQPSGDKLDLTFPNLCDIKTTEVKAKILHDATVVKAKTLHDATVVKVKTPHDATVVKL